ncbi:MAG: pyridoxamine 5'-phosphate oxidase family protein, partial [Rhodospirillaceae bacterium]
TDRTRLRRAPKRGHFDRDTINGILDAMPQCHVGWVRDGAPMVIPTFHWREGDHVYWHSSNGGPLSKAGEDPEVCLTVTILDGFVMARSGMHHSANYRSVMIFGKARRITDPDAKVARLRGFFEGLWPGRWDMLRPITELEIKATAVYALPIAEASAKMRTGGPIDDEEDYALPIWAGILPVTTHIGAPEPDPRNLPGLTPPAHLGALKIG